MTTDTILNEIAKRHCNVLARLKAVASPPPVLTAVSKQQTDDRIEAMLAAGQNVFGENRVQEATARWAKRRAVRTDLKLHLIGPLQTNKCDDAVALFDVIETLDRPKLVKALAKSCEKMGRFPQFLIQVNTGSEEQKAGVLVAGVPALLTEARSAGLDVTGLMCIPPVDEPAGPHFGLLAKIARAHGLSTLSMGMSGDFEIAAQFGATHVRVGTALFGER